MPSLLRTSILRASGDDKTSKERTPWDVLRFIGQSSKFITPPKLPFISNVMDGERIRVQPGDTLWAPSSKENFFSFAPLDDVVMGGASFSTIDNNTGIWRGTVTDANNGGFVGIRSTPFKAGIALDTRGCEGIELKIRMGDGKRFKFVVRDTTEFNGVCWTTAFDATPSVDGANFLNSLGNVLGDSSDKSANDEKSTLVRLPFAKQVPTIFAKTVSGRTFDSNNVVGLQLAYSKFDFDGKLNQNFELGDFSLQILEVKVY